MSDKFGFATKALHIGQPVEKEFNSVVPPIYMTTTYKQDTPGEPKVYDYTRSGNPNFGFLEETLASLENAKFATIFSSGLGGVTSILSRLQPGERVISIDDVYGGTFRLMKNTFLGQHIDAVFGDINDEGWVKSELAKGARLIWIESPTNPLLTLADIEKLAALAHEHNAELVVDNTFASSYFQSPLSLGADLVLHSCTKYIGGHSDIVGGCVATNSKEWKDHLDYARKAIGFNPSPFDAWLLSRSIKTLAVRMERHQENAWELAKRLSKHPKVKTTIYPGLESHPQHSLAQKQMSGYSGIVSVIFNTDLQETKKLIASFKLIKLAESLGAVESLVCHPASMTHASIPRDLRVARGLDDGLIRISVGLEDIEDLWADITSVLDEKGS
ncbi:trans-sulfuration enzyme family protein [Candidatus Uabimicrobium amorphum]|uniref:Cystathionine beta-lyase n=1 Tax=Uabimicrobium amorphum TaxID=2596890 RepID=A0A5S9IL38_UABAM|nr:PLP-dependent aspartate aminotransferase family protein [Candidatus Uabimicrobium amorphum]BBM83694.1 cystathionine beta-lyase [Candidatus Uabimicrobium amorphum]